VWYWLASRRLAGSRLRAPALAADGPSTTGAVYTMTNSPAGNAIEAYARVGDGSLTPGWHVPDRR